MIKYTLLAFVTNKSGVLSKISGLLRRKMYNISTLTVSETADPKISRMTITLDADNPEKIKQVMLQIQKLTEVISIESLDPESSFWREVALIKCSLKLSKLTYLQNHYTFDVLSEKKDTIIIQIAGTSRKIDAFLGEVMLKNIIEYTRSGVTSLKE